MRFGVFYELQLPRPWEEDSELRLVQEAIEQVQLADRIGIDLVVPNGLRQTHSFP